MLQGKVKGPRISPFGTPSCGIESGPSRYCESGFGRMGRVGAWEPRPREAARPRTKNPAARARSAGCFMGRLDPMSTLRLPLPRSAGDAGGRDPAVVAVMPVGAVIHEKLRGPAPAVLIQGATQERRIAVDVLPIDPGSSLEQQGGQIWPLLAGREVEGGLAVVILHVDVRAGIEQDGDDFFLAIQHGVKERGSALPVDDVVPVAAHEQPEDFVVAP